VQSKFRVETCISNKQIQCLGKTLNILCYFKVPTYLKT